MLQMFGKRTQSPFCFCGDWADDLTAYYRGDRSSADASVVRRGFALVANVTRRSASLSHGGGGQLVDRLIVPRPCSAIMTRTVNLALRSKIHRGRKASENGPQTFFEAIDLDRAATLSNSAHSARAATSLIQNAASVRGCKAKLGCGESCKGTGGTGGKRSEFSPGPKKNPGPLGGPPKFFFSPSFATRIPCEAKPEIASFGSRRQLVYVRQVQVTSKHLHRSRRLPIVFSEHRHCANRPCVTPWLHVDVIRRETC